MLLDENANTQIYCHPPPSQASSNGTGGGGGGGVTTSGSECRTLSTLCRYIMQLESELRLRGHTPIRPHAIVDALKLNALRESLAPSSVTSSSASSTSSSGAPASAAAAAAVGGVSGVGTLAPSSTHTNSPDERTILETLSETAIKALLNR